MQLTALRHNKRKTMKTKSLRKIGLQLERLDETNENRNNIICKIARRYAENIIKHCSGYKNDSEFARIYNTDFPRAIYAGY